MLTLFSSISPRSVYYSLPSNPILCITYYLHPYLLRKKQGVNKKIEKIKDECKLEIEAVKVKVIEEKRNVLNQCFNCFKILNLVNCCSNFRLGRLEALKDPFDCQFSDPYSFDEQNMPSSHIVNHLYGVYHHRQHVHHSFLNKNLVVV